MTAPFLKMIDGIFGHLKMAQSSKMWPQEKQQKKKISIFQTTLKMITSLLKMIDGIFGHLKMAQSLEMWPQEEQQKKKKNFDSSNYS